MDINKIVQEFTNSTDFVFTYKMSDLAWVLPTSLSEEVLPHSAKWAGTRLMPDCLHIKFRLLFIVTLIFV